MRRVTHTTNPAPAEFVGGMLEGGLALLLQLVDFVDKLRNLISAPKGGGRKICAKGEGSMGRLIGAVTPGNLDENYFLEKAAAYFDDQVVIYRNRRVFGRGLDVCISYPKRASLWWG